MKLLLCPGLAIVLAAALPALASAQQTPPLVVLKPGMVITRSVRIAPRTYPLPVPNDSPLITIRGDDITVDFNGAVLQGTTATADPDQASGIALFVDGGSKVRIVRARVHGYKVGLLARGTRGLSITDGDFSRNWKPRLYSEIEHESLVDWLSHHHNEKDEWLRFGAGIYLRDVHAGEIRGNRIEHGMEGLMITGSDSLRIWNNIIQFNSGVGIGLYRSSHNLIMHNYASFNVRGFSQGFYRRGQDSADLLMYEQSSHNIVAFNSMTHGGDGLFLWSGQTTMDTGTGGSNDNIFYANDFSYAPTNAMEATFSRNAFIANRAVGSEHGLWGGYSYESEISRNEFGGNRIGIAIEHGQHNRIVQNTFAADSTAISLWAVPEQPSDWAYPKHHDTRSHDYQVSNNTFRRNRVALRVANTQELRVGANQFERVDSGLVVRDTLSHVMPTSGDTTAPAVALPERLAGGLDPKLDPLARRPRADIIVDEWGPYDWRTPRLWPVGSSYQNPLPLRVLGPAGTWRVVAQTGIKSLSRTSGRMNDTIRVAPAAGSAGNWSITLQDQRGRKFSYSRFEPIAQWSVDFYEWKDNARGTLLAHADTSRLDYMWYSPTIPGVPQANFAIVATSTVTLPAGDFTLRSISDDAVRVWVDDQLVIDDWEPHESKVDNASIAAGAHKLRVEHYQKDGWTELRVEIVRGKQVSTGSPAPH